MMEPVKQLTDRQKDGVRVLATLDLSPKLIDYSLALVESITDEGAVDLRQMDPRYREIWGQKIMQDIKAGKTWKVVGLNA